ncbi:MULTISPECIES: D-alanyl-D-alanine carboxypeptidase family protein [unclassified Clostridium]|mgnify:FL=1|jgi:serine-type D-ala-D-ala carboxypeptidase|uniref:D-alanyl-D-alanine carboxypeptidase family protein n=1 Tax=unclassified Clostridium TaxID=2614128 RepID=UPI0025F1FE61|nr:serine hydrolase [Clostridium sp.]MCI6693382.1 serine hydrolase [Clostridium sp.]MDY2632738.1 serine hydrolase [Clostridium sp.]MDY4253495.1 serine hydrolase [Clostridium sp.]MDY6228140.1 serine hydrolase [Clostridium sp.]
MNLKAKNLFKTLALALSVSLLAPLANKVSAEDINIQAPEIIGEASITMDIDTGEVIYSKNADLKLSPASTTKLMTALLFAENKNRTDTLSFSDTSLKVTETALNNYGSVKAGDKISAEDTMKAVLIFSANDAAYLMAESVGGTVDNFVNMMNEKAKELGLTDTNFENPSGLEIDPLNPSNTNINQTTAYDLAKIGIAAFKNEWVKDTISAKNIKTSITLSGNPMELESRNKILGKYNNIGGKTGTEVLAGHCFVGFFEKDGRDLVTVVLKSEYGVDGTNVFKDTEKVADYSYSAQKETYKNSGDEVGTVDLTYKTFGFFGAEKQITAPIYLNQDVQYYKNDFNDKYASISYNGEVNNAWKFSGNKEVTLTYSTPGYSQDVLGTIKVSAMELVKANLPLYLLSLLILVIVLILVILLIKIISTNKRNRRRRYY